jgi:hypothetical protein
VDLRALKRRWRKKNGKFSDYEYRKQPGFDMNTFEGANQTIPMKTLVIHCLDANLNFRWCNLTLATLLETPYCPMAIERRCHT